MKLTRRDNLELLTKCASLAAVAAVAAAGDYCSSLWREDDDDDDDDDCNSCQLDHRGNG